MENQYNILVDLVGTVLVGVILLVERRQPKRGDPITAKLLHYLMLCCTLVFLTDIPGLAMDGCAFPGARVLLWIFDTTYWILQAVYCWLWLAFADYWAFGTKERLRKSGLIFALPMLAEILLVLTNPLTGWVFTINAANVYDRGSYYAVNLVPFLLYIAGALVVTVYGYLKSDDAEQKRRCLSLMVYMFLPICGVAFEAFVYGISWVWPMVALSLLMVYLNVKQMTLAEERVLSEKQAQDARVAIMLSQIQPHFLFNSLTAISQLCEKDPMRAKKATIDFSQYLRVNLDSLKQNTPVPFEKELQHLKTYLELEQMRFGEDLHIVYDIKVSNFRVPSLSIQPLVENAVKYGVGEREDGGTVTLSTDETEDFYIITVTDDGVGFDPNETQPDGRTHIGIDNVSYRISQQCGGRLEITSQKGVGTTATVKIPKEAGTP